MPDTADTTRPQTTSGQIDHDLVFWRGHTDAKVQSCLEIAAGWSRACPPKPVPDDPAKLVLRDADGVPRAVLVGSAAAAPDLAARHARRAHQVVEALPSSLASVVLTPLLAGEAEGRSYVVWPYRVPAGDGRLAQWLWRRRLAGPVSSWLLSVTEATRTPIPAGQVGTHLLEPLAALQAVPGISARVIESAEAAIRAFSSGALRPVHVLMHNDLWTGNLLAGGIHSESGPFSFTIIDWAGAEVQGYPGYDLARWSASVRQKPAAYGRALARHGTVLGCEAGGMASYLAAALGYLAMHLEGLSPQRFVRLADECMQRQSQALATLGPTVKR